MSTRSARGAFQRPRPPRRRPEPGRARPAGSGRAVGVHRVAWARYSSVACTRRLMVSSLARPSRPKISLTCFSTARRRQVRGRAAIARLLLPWATSAMISRWRGVRSSSGECWCAALACDQLVDQPRVDAALAGGHGGDGRDQVVEVVDAVLQQVAAAHRAAGQQLGGVVRALVLAQHDDADLRVRLAQALGDLHAFVGLGGRHADVGDHDIGRVGIHRRQQRRAHRRTAPTTRICGASASSCRRPSRMR